jgi:hypothetical protein
MPTPLLRPMATSPKIQTTWTNFDATQTIYITSDPTKNQVTLALANRLGDRMTFPPGTPVQFPPSGLPPGQSAIYIFFKGLITDDQVRAITIAAIDSRWRSASFVDPKSGAYLVVAPIAQVVVDNEKSLEFKLTNILASSSNSAQVSIEILGGTGIPPGQTHPHVFVTVQDPPPAGDVPLNLDVGFAGRDLVFTGGQTNELTLYLTNPNPKPLVPGGLNSWGPNPPKFTLSLVFGDGDGALTTKALATNIGVNLGDTFGNSWDPVKKKTQGDLPQWEMTPTRSTAGGTVLGTGQNATVSFNITDIISTLAQGLTYAYLSYSKIPGYLDGFFAVEIYKVNPIKITNFTANPSSISDPTTPMQVTLNLTVANAGYVTITNSSYGKSVDKEIHTDSTPVTVYATTTFTLIATNSVTGQQLAQALTVPVTAKDPGTYALVAKSIHAATANVNGLTIQSSDSDPTLPLQVGKSSTDNYLKILKDGTVNIGTGKVGIGVSAAGPQAKLDVNGDMAATSIRAGTANLNGLTIQNSDSDQTLPLQVGKPSNDPAQRGNYLKILKDGTVNIGTGNVGIGVGPTGPQAKLDVNGDIIVRGAVKGSYSRSPSGTALLSNSRLGYNVFYPIDQWQPATDFFSLGAVGSQHATVIQGFSATYPDDHPHQFAIAYIHQGGSQNTAFLVDLSTGSLSGVHKSFIIDHPLHEHKYLVHATMEGPEGAVYYRGTARLQDGKAEIQLPDYFEALTHREGRTIQLTNLDGFDQLSVSTLKGVKIKDGRFLVVSADPQSSQEFDWEVKAVRKDIERLEVEPLKSAIQVERFGPYAYTIPKRRERN